MKEFKGTEGKWIAEKDFSKEYEQHVFKINDVNETVEGLAEVYSGTDDDTCREFKECEANAKLIAAAPELLEALQETDKDLCVLESTMAQIEKENPRAEGMAELLKKWRARNKEALNKAL